MLASVYNYTVAKVTMDCDFDMTSSEGKRTLSKKKQRRNTVLPWKNRLSRV
jgi:hypothetical protein